MASSSQRQGLPLDKLLDLQEQVESIRSRLQEIVLEATMPSAQEEGAIRPSSAVTTSLEVASTCNARTEDENCRAPQTSESKEATSVQQEEEGTR